MFWCYFEGHVHRNKIKPKTFHLSYVFLDIGGERKWEKFGRAVNLPHDTTIVVRWLLIFVQIIIFKIFLVDNVFQIDIYFAVGHSLFKTMVIY